MLLVLEFFKKLMLFWELESCLVQDICFLAAEGVRGGDVLLFLPSRAGVSWKTRG